MTHPIIDMHRTMKRFRLESHIPRDLHLSGAIAETRRDNKCSAAYCNELQTKNPKIAELYKITAGYDRCGFGKKGKYF